MKAQLQHLQINVHDIDFYKKLFAYFDYTVFSEGDTWIGAGTDNVSIWVMKVEEAHKDKPYSRHGRGIHHLGFAVDSRADVDKFFEEFVKKNTLKFLHGGPKDYPEYGPTYYSLSFEDPEEMVIEVVYKKS